MVFPPADCRNYQSRSCYSCIYTHGPNPRNDAAVEDPESPLSLIQSSRDTRPSDSLDPRKARPLHSVSSAATGAARRIDRQVHVRPPAPRGVNTEGKRPSTQRCGRKAGELRCALPLAWVFGVGLETGLNRTQGPPPGQPRPRFPGSPASSKAVRAHLT